MTPGREAAIVLLSGGIDSAVALRWAIGEGYEVRALTFDYHGRAPAEAAATERLAALAGVPLERVALPFLREVGDLPESDRRRFADLGGRVPAAYVPGRNVVFYGIAAARAEALGAAAIVGGHVASDPEGFPDSSPDFFRALESALRIGAWTARAGGREIRLLMPLARLSKEDVLRRALALGVPLEATFSCYGAAPVPCGACPACEERAEAFAALRVADPALARG